MNEVDWDTGHAAPEASVEGGAGPQGPALGLYRGCVTAGVLLRQAIRGAVQPARPETLQAWSRATLHHMGVQVESRLRTEPVAPLLVANHLSWLDPLVLMSLWPSWPLAKRELAQYPLIGALARAAGIRFVDRSAMEDRLRALRQVRQEWQQGARVLLFPEGTTTPGTGVAPLARGGIGLAYRLGLSLTPVRLDCADPHYPWLGEASLGPHLWAVLCASTTRVRVQQRPTLHPADVTTLSAWLEAVRTALLPEESAFHAR